MMHFAAGQRRRCGLLLHMSQRSVVCFMSVCVMYRTVELTVSRFGDSRKHELDERADPDVLASRVVHGSILCDPIHTPIS